MWSGHYFPLRLQRRNLSGQKCPSLINAPHCGAGNASSSVDRSSISGANKLFVAGGTKPVYETLVKAKVPFPRQTAYFVSGVEFVCGSLLTVGFLSSPASVALLIDMTVATLTSALSTLPKGLSPLSWLDDFLYLPEVLYVLFFVWLICSGPGKFSVDCWLAGT
jgi:putative oxidoreductase